VVCVDVSAEDERAHDRLDRLDEQAHDLRLAALAEVWYTFDDSFHASLSSSLRKILQARSRAVPRAEETRIA
jgi:hypothetical protein